jgi:phage terminase large subunit
MKPLTPDEISRRQLYQALPDKWVQDVSGEVPWAKQCEIMRALVVHPRVAVASANSCGKTYLAARLVVWWLAMYRPSIVVTTAPTDRQVTEVLWREVRAFAAKAKARGKGLGGRLLLTNKWEFAEDHFAIGFSTKDNDPDKFQGFHSPHTLVIADEAAGISEMIFEGITAILKGEHNRLLAIGNPTSLEGWFFEAFKSEGWWTDHISALDTPNLKQNRIVVPGLVTAADVEQGRIDYGEGSPLWQSRILGQFPDRLDDTLIPIAWVEAAGEREPGRGGEVVVGADFARGGSDSTVFVARHGMNLFAAEEHNQKNTMEAAGLLVQFCKRVGATRLQGDVIGLGSGPMDRVRELMPDLEVVEMGAGSSAWDDANYANLGVEWYSVLAELLRTEKAGGKVFQNKRAISELTSRKREIRSDGRWQLEAKEKVKKRGGRSPDWGDAIAMCYAPRPKAGLIEYYRQLVEAKNAPVAKSIAPNLLFNGRTGGVEVMGHNGRPAEPKSDLQAPNVQHLIDVYNQAFWGAQPKELCVGCGEPFRPAENRITDFIDSWHAECKPPF